MMKREQAVPEIADSWQRCINQYQLDNSHVLNPPKLSAPEIKLARESFFEVFHSAGPIFNRLATTANNNACKIHASDMNGILVEEYARQKPHSDGLQLAPGRVLTEALVGTNGAGTCLAIKKPITVYASEHFSRAFHGFTCSGAPLISPFGEVLGTLSISSYATHHKVRHDWALNYICDIAAEVEAAVFRATYDRYHLISFMANDNKQSGISDAVIAVNDSGWIIGVTSSALQILAIKERHALIGQGIASVVGYSLEDLHRHCSLPLQCVDDRCTWLVRVEQQSQSVTTRGAQLNFEQLANSRLYQVAGSDPRLRRNAEVCHKIIDKQISILLQGETGTGKEVWARAIHDSSARSEQPFITLNCAAIPESLIESELFGYTPGTFTGGLKKGKIGKIEASHGGTLFLDEIGDMPVALQARLLRVLAEGEVTPLGQLDPVKVDLNVICATHRNLQANVERGDFREDLYYRISGVSLTLLALRERSDCSEIINKVLHDVSDNQQICIDQYAMSVLSEYHWPGNIRQLKNVLNYAVSMSDGKTLRIIDLPDDLFSSASEQKKTKDTLAANNALLFSDKSAISLNSNQVAQTCVNEKDRILNALVENRWVVLRAAQSLGISRSTLHRKIKIYGLN